MTLPSAHHIRGALLCVLCVALIVGLSRDVVPEARDAGQLAVLVVYGAMARIKRDLGPQPPTDGGPSGTRAPTTAPAADAHGSAAPAGAANDAAPLARVPEWMATSEAMAAHVATKGSRREVEFSCRLWGRLSPALRELYAQRLDAITPADHHGTRPNALAFAQAVELWAQQGPMRRRETPAAVRGAA